MRISLQPFFLLHHRPYRETSAIVELMTHDYGRISAVARGVRAPRSQTRALLQPFMPLLASWQGKTELLTLLSVESNGMPFKLQGKCLLSAFYLNELLVRLLAKQDPHPSLYILYQQTLLELQNNPFQQKILRIFEKKLLEELGYSLQLQYDIPDNKPLLAESKYVFYSEQGFKRYQEQDLVSSAFIFSGKSLLALAREELDDPESLRDAKRLMRLALAPLLGSQPLHSRKLFAEVEMS